MMLAYGRDDGRRALNRVLATLMGCIAFFLKRKPAGLER